MVLRKRQCFIPAIFLGCLLAVGCGTSTPPPSDNKGQPSQPSQPSDGPAKGAEATEPAFKGKSADLLKEFKADKEAAIKKYENKVVEVDAVVTEFQSGKEEDNLGFSADKQATSTSLVCTLTPEARQKLREMAKGQDVTIRGLVYLAIPDKVFLKDCTFTKVGTNPGIKVTAKDLGAEFAKDEGEPANKKYTDKFLFVEGVIKDVREGKEGFIPTYHVVLETGTDRPMSCRMANEEEFKKVKKGDKVVLKGDSSPELIALKQYPALTDARVVKKD